jgi:hypothetical protein
MSATSTSVLSFVQDMDRLPCRYRGYEIVPNRQWSQWCVSVYTTRADLPLFSRSMLRTLALGKDEAVAEAKQCIDRLLHS